MIEALDKKHELISKLISNKYVPPTAVIFSLLAILFSILSASLNLYYLATSSGQTELTDVHIYDGPETRKRKSADDIIIVKLPINDVFKTCRHRSKMGQIHYNTELKPNIDHILEVEFAPARGYVLIDSVCSSIGATEKYMIMNDDTGRGKCICAGRTKIKELAPRRTDEEVKRNTDDNPKYLRCFVHFWECRIL